MRVWDFVLKELRQAMRDRRLVGMLFGMPIIQLLLYGYAVTQDIRHLKILVCDLDHTSLSRQIVTSVKASPEYFEVVGYVSNVDAARKYLASGSVSLVLVIPRQFEDQVHRGRTGTLQALVDGSDPNVGTVATSYLGKIVSAQATSILNGRLAAAGLGRSVGAIDARVEFWYNPTLESSFSLVPGVVCLITGNLTIFMTSMAVVRERELGTIEQLLVTPMRPWELMLGKLIPYMMMGFANVTTTVVLAQLLFNVPMRGSMVTLYAVSGLFMLGSLGLGLLVSTMSKTQQQAQMLASLIVMPNMMLSGFMYPVSNMPAWLQPVTYLMPMRYFLTCVRGLMLKGNGFPQLIDQIWPLALLSTVILVTAIRRFHKRLD